MGCLVAKCSLTNIGLREGNTVVLNIITPTQRIRSWSNDKIKFTDLTGTEVTSTPVLNDSVNQPHNSFTFYSPVGISLKAEYTGWKSFDLNLDDEDTLENFKALARQLVVSSSDRYNTKFNAIEFQTLMTEKMYTEAWECLNTAFQNDGVYIYDEDELIKLDMNVICQEAIDIIEQIAVQNDIYDDLYRSSNTIKSVADFKKDIPAYLTYLREKEKEHYKDFDIVLANESIEYTVERIIQEIERPSSYEHYPPFSFRNPTDCCIFAEELRLCETFEEVEIILQRLVYANYLNLAYAYYNAILLPIVCVNFEEYCNDRASKFNQLQTEVIQQKVKIKLADAFVQEVQIRLIEQLVEQGRMMVIFEKDLSDYYVNNIPLIKTDDVVGRITRLYDDMEADMNLIKPDFVEMFDKNIVEMVPLYSVDNNQPVRIYALVIKLREAVEK